MARLSVLWRDQAASGFSARSEAAAFPTFFIAGTALRLAGGHRWCLGLLDGGGEQVAGGQAAEGPPFLGDGEDLLLGGEVVELVGGLDGLTQRQVARQDDIVAAQRDDEGALHGPRAYPRNRGELRHQLVIGQAAQDLR